MLTALAATSAQAEYADALTTPDLTAQAGSGQPGAFQEARPPGREPTYQVSRVVLEYAQDHPDHPDVRRFSDLQVSLAVGPEGLISPRPGLPVVLVAVSEFGLRDPRTLTPTAIRAINQRIVDEFNRLGYVGVLIEPNPDDIDPRTGRDLRPSDRTELRLVIWTGRISRIRTFASGDRIDREERVDNREHQRIIERSPLQPVGAGGPGSLMRLSEVENYLARLNRHPGRRVDVALAPANDPGGVFLDYLIAENKPWAFYYNVANTGTRNTSHSRQRIGYMNTQLTGRDDILQLDYYGDFEDVAAFTGSYDAPWFGSDSWRVNLGGSTATYSAEDLGQNLANFDGDTRTAELAFTRSIYQDGRFFIDMNFGGSWQYIRTDNKLARISAHDQFFLPGLGTEMEYRSDTSNFFGMIYWEANISGIANTDDSDASGAGGLGRWQPDENFQILSWNFNGSTYLEPLLNGDAFRDLSTPASSTLAHELAFRLYGQYAFNNRLVPQMERVAGGLYTVRGYPQATVAGDNVYLGSLEYAFHLPRICSPGPPVDLPGLGEFRMVPQQPGGRPDWDLSLRGFVDAARVTLNDRTRFERNNTLVGGGFGVELQVRRNITMRFDWGWALNDVEQNLVGGGTRDIVESGDDEAYFSITTLY